MYALYNVLYYYCIYGWFNSKALSRQKKKDSEKPSEL